MHIYIHTYIYIYIYTCKHRSAIARGRIAIARNRTAIVDSKNRQRHRPVRLVAHHGLPNRLQTCCGCVFQC